MKRGITGLFLKLTAIALSTLPPVIATLSYFPIWREGGALPVVSGFTLLLLLFSLSPLMKLITRLLKSPTSTGLWLCLFIIFFALSKIADEMVVISLVGYLGNLLASFIWRILRSVTNERQ